MSVLYGRSESAVNAIWRLLVRLAFIAALDPSKWPKDPTTGSAFPGGIIPQNRISPNSHRLLQNYPAPNFTLS